MTTAQTEARAIDALERREQLIDVLRDAAEHKSRAELYATIATLTQENAELRAEVERLTRERTTVWGDLDIATVLLPRDFVERVVEIANRNEQSPEGDRLASRHPSPYGERE